MTTIHIRITVPTITGVNVGAKGRLRWTPTLRRNVDPNTVVLPKGFDVDLVSGEARVNVAPTLANWCWKVEEGLYKVGVPNGTTRYVSVPDSETVINYIDLPDLDPATLEPSAAPSAVWDVELSQVEERVTTLENAPPAHTHDNLDALDQVSGINTGDQDLSGYATITQPINPQTGTTYELVAADAGKLVTCTNGAAITVTVPANVFTAGQRVDVAVLGEGMVTLVGSGITLNPEAGLSLVSRAQYSAFTIYFLDATTAFVTGSMAVAA